MFNLKNTQTNFSELITEKPLPELLVQFSGDSYEIDGTNYVRPEIWLDYVDMAKFNRAAGLRAEFVKMLEYFAGRLHILTKYKHFNIQKCSTVEFQKIIKVIYNLFPPMLADLAKSRAYYDEDGKLITFLDEPGELITLFLADSVIGGVQLEVNAILKGELSERKEFFQDDASLFAYRILLGKKGYMSALANGGIHAVTGKTRQVSDTVRLELVNTVINDGQGDIKTPVLADELKVSAGADTSFESKNIEWI